MHAASTTPNMDLEQHSATLACADAPNPRQWREALGLDQREVAQRCCLSPRQLQQIEEGGDSAFYSASIKAHAQRRLMDWLARQANQRVSQVAAAN